MPNTMTNFTSNLVISQQLRNQQAQAMTTPIATPITAIIHHQANSAPIPKNNIRFNYVNNNSPNVNNNNNHNNLLAANSPLPSPHANIPKRIFSAEPGNKNNKYLFDSFFFADLHDATNVAHIFVDLIL
jgi:hypothetical protein